MSGLESRWSRGQIPEGPQDLPLSNRILPRRSSATIRPSGISETISLESEPTAAPLDVQSASTIPPVRAQRKSLEGVAGVRESLSDGTALMETRAIGQDPERMQYKRDTVAGGLSALLKDVKKWDIVPTHVGQTAAMTPQHDQSQAVVNRHRIC